MLETRKKTIGDTEYEVTQLDAIRGRKVMLRLGKALAPLFAGTTKVEALANIGNALSNVSDEDLDFLCDTFASSTCVVQSNAKPSLSKTFALHFAGKYDEMLQWLLFCLEVNFGSFFDRLRSKVAASPEKDSE